MTTSNTGMITVETTVNASIEKVWKLWSEPDHITKWNNASPDWHTPKATNDLRDGGAFSFTMAAKDGSMSFDFGGKYTNVKPHQQIDYTLEDGRKVNVSFASQGNSVKVTEHFDPENTHPRDFQQAGWQAIIDNFKNYVEADKS